MPRPGHQSQVALRHPYQTQQAHARQTSIRYGLARAADVAIRHALHRADQWSRGTQTRHHHKHHKGTGTDKEERIVSNDLLSGINSSRITAYLHKRPHGFVKGTYVRTNEAYQTSVQSGSGLQGSVLICELGGAANLLGATNGHASPQDLAIPAYQVIPDTPANAGTYYTAPGAEPFTQRLVMYHTELSMQFVSAGNASQTIKLYLVKAKQNIANVPTGTAGQFTRQDALSYWSNTFQTQGLGKVVETFLPAGGGAPGFGSVNHPGITPSDNKLFKAAFEIVGEHTMHLAPNGVEIVNLSIFNNQVFDVGKTMNLCALTSIGGVGSGFNTGLLKGGYSVFAITLGQPAKDAGGTFTHAPAEFGVIVSRKISWGGLQSKQKQFTTIQAQSSLLAPAAATNLKINQTNTVPATGVQPGVM